MRFPILSVFVLGCVAAQVVEGAVLIEGISSSLEANVRAHMRLDDEACEQDRDQIRYRFSRAEQNIRAALRPFGYYDPTVTATLEQPESACWEALFKVSPGEPIMVSDVLIEVHGGGSEIAQFQTLIDGSGIHPGVQLNHNDYEATKNRLLVTAREYGFFDAMLISNELRVDRVSRQARISLVLDTGVRYTFGQLYIHGDVLEETLLRRYVQFNSGAPFEQRLLRKLHNDLVRGDFFASVDIRTETRPDRTADVHLTLEEGRRVRYGVGLGFGTDTGLVVSGDIVNRRVNRYGHRLELDAELSRVRQNGTASYRMPGKRPQNDWYSLYGGLNREDTDAIESIAWKMGVRENWFHTLNWNSNPFIEVVAERFREDGEWREKMALVPGYGIGFVDANATDRPTRGVRLSVEVAGASDKVLSDTSFVRLLFRGKTILPLTERGRLLLRGEAGWMEAEDFDKVVPTWRFFAGGDRSVRGYDYQSLGPVDDDGKSLGGSRLLTGSIEADWRFRERWSGALFMDAGNVGEGDLLENLPWSVGFGVRWYSPVGPIRLDLAFPQEGGNNFRVHISMGPDL